MKAIRWFAGFFEDQAGSASSKRAALYFALFELHLIVSGSLGGKPVDQTVLFTVAAIIGTAMGFSTMELFKPRAQDIKKEQTTTETKTEMKTT